MDSLAGSLRAGDVCWLSGFGGVKVNGASLWPARLVADKASAMPAAVQKARKPNTVLVKSFGDNAYVWAKPTAVRAFDVDDVDEAQLAKAASRVQTALREALATVNPKQKSKQKSKPSKREGFVMPKMYVPMTSPPAAAAAPAKRHAEARAPAPRLSLPPVVERNASGLSDYELQRLETMRQNQLVLESLGVASASASLRLASATPEKPSVDPAVRAAKAAERHARLLEAQANRRTSPRMQELPDGGQTPRAPKRYSDEYASLDEAERESTQLRKKMRRASAAARSSGTRKKEERWLSADERAAIAEAYEEAEGWLDEMREYFEDKLSEANLRNVMKQATALATGEGVPHTIKSTWFRQGEPVSLDEDLVQLRIEANRFLDRNDDPGHGWRLDHPIGKMGLFQAYLHSKRS